jgi:hypothetical protein
VAGYSPRALPDKLGIKPAARVVLLNGPEGFEDALAPLPEGVRISRRLSPGADLVVAFFRRRAELARTWARVTAATSPTGAVWVAWPKRASGVPTDLTDNVIREVVLPTGWVDTKVCAIDDTWSGLKCVLRVALRPAPAGRRPSRGSSGTASRL